MALVERREWPRLLRERTLRLGGGNCCEVEDIENLREAEVGEEGGETFRDTMAVGGLPVTVL